MKILIVYGTYSGSTLVVAEKIKELLTEDNHEVDIKDVMNTIPQDLSSYEVVFLGSCTWQFEKKDGQPHMGYAMFRGNLKNIFFEDKYFAVFALGDENYLNYCAAADYLLDCIKDLKATNLISPLRINQYYMHEEENNRIISHWVDNIRSKLR